MQVLQLFIENERVDLYKDESVSITQSIKNVKDISKIFTEFTRHLQFRQLKQITGSSNIITILIS